MKKMIMSIILIGLLITASVVSVNAGVGHSEKQEGQVLIAIPSQFDLRNVSGKNYVTGVRDQGDFGTCWAHGALASMEGNLLMTGNWDAAGERGEPDLSERHLVWWSGFNWYSNDDDPGHGLGPLWGGGDYRMVSAYLTRGEGAIREEDAPYRSLSYKSQRDRSILIPPARYEPSYHHYYARDIEWYVAERDLSNINTIKYKIMEEGVIGTCMWIDIENKTNWQYFYDENETPIYLVSYQPPNSSFLPNHAVAIVGWSDSLITQAPNDGAWLCKNSGGNDSPSKIGGGYFWISYYDKWCCQEPFMGAVSFQDVEYQPHENIYYHDYHGWRDTMADAFDVFNAFTAKRKESLEAVSFYTAVDDVDYTVRIFDRFEDGELKNIRSSISGTLDYTGFHTIDLDTPVELNKSDNFYIYLKLSDGGYPIDRTSEINTLLGSSGRTIVKSSAKSCESYYRSLDNLSWLDLYEYDFTNSAWNYTANFCIKGLSTNLESGTAESEATFTEDSQNIQQQSLPSGSPTNN